MSKLFSIEIDGLIQLATEEIWPDHDSPDNPTIEEVAARVEEAGSVSALISEWNLPVDVLVDGHPTRLR